jgi:hypothetical protein
MTAKVIAERVDPDIIGVVEPEDRRSLQRFIAELLDARFRHIDARRLISESLVSAVSAGAIFRMGIWGKRVTRPTDWQTRRSPTANSSRLRGQLRTSVSIRATNGVCRW